MARVLILFAHPAFQKSRVNRVLLDAVRDIPDVTVHDLYEAYPDFHIHVAKEQAQLLEHDVIIFQHPFYWFSCPALLKEWMDLVLAHGFAYGKGGQRLAGKKILSAITAGGSEAAYLENQAEQLTCRKLLLPFTRMSATCRLIQLPPFVVFGTYLLGDPALEAYARDYAEIIGMLVRNEIAPEACGALNSINALAARTRPGGPDAG